VAGGILASAPAGLWPAISPARSSVSASDEAKDDDQRFREGGALMTVKAGDRYVEASQIARRRRGDNYKTRNDRPVRERQEFETRR
jgi:hypothetical protein